jgi:uncharacterized protein (DUF2062 family)
MAFRDKLRGVLQIEDTPHRIAMSFALGIFWGMSPLLGIHTIGAFFTAWFLGLNRFVAVVGVYITNPWTIVPIYSFSLWLGARLTGMKQILSDMDLENITFMYLMNKLSPLILPFFVGTFVVGVASGIVSYFIIHKAVVNYRNKIKNAA